MEKIMKNKLLALILIALLGTAAGIGLFRSESAKAISPNLSIATSYEQEITSWLKSEEDKVWKMLEKHGLSKEKFAEEAQRLREVHKKECLDTRLDFGGCTDTVSQELKDLIARIAKELNIDISHVEILSYWGKSPMAAMDYLFLIHPDFVKSLGPDVLEYTIAHELQHIKNQDNLWTFIAERYLPEAGRQAKNHPFNYLRRFKEMRADIGAILAGYGEGHHAEFSGKVNAGKKTPGITHPTNEQRLHVSVSLQEQKLPTIQLA
jgi:hypothetical protein